MRNRPYRDHRGVAKYRHEVLAAILRVNERLEVLATPRSRDPFVGQWALIGGPVEVDETMEQAIARHMTGHLDGARPVHVEQVSTVSDPARDPFERTIATAYLALTLPDGLPEVVGNSWLPVDDLPNMAFDHAQIVSAAARRLRSKTSYTNIVYALAPEEFTMARLRAIYQAVLGHEVDVTNLGRVLRRRGQIEKTGDVAAPGERGGRPASTWRFIDRRYVVTDPFAVLAPGN